MASNPISSEIEMFMDRLKRAPVRGTTGGFYAKGNRVCFHSAFFLFPDDPVDEAPKETLLEAQDVKGNYGIVIPAKAVAEILARMLNESMKLISSP